MEELFYQIALTQAKGIGHQSARALISRFGSAKAIFEASKEELLTVDMLGEKRLQALQQGVDTSAVEREMAFLQKHQIQPLFINHPHYPPLLKECPDAPVLLYFKGKADLLRKKALAIVGTRNHTDYGRQMVEELIRGFRGRKDIVVVSGLAFGIDTIAHRAALHNGLATVGVLGHGLDRIYPHQNTKMAEEMLQQGGLLTEYPSGTTPDRQHFPQRNRIVAGMSDVVVVAETGIKGGSMITAKLACSYNREVTAFPGRTVDSRSSGCNYLIKTNIAHLITGAEDLIMLMNWQPEKAQQQAVQQKLFATLTPEEKKIADALTRDKETHIDELAIKTGMADSRMAAILLSLELEGVVRSLPGKRYRLS